MHHLSETFDSMAQMQIFDLMKVPNETFVRVITAHPLYTWNLSDLKLSKKQMHR